MNDKNRVHIEGYTDTNSANSISLNILLLLNGIKCEKEYHMRD